MKRVPIFSYFAFGYDYRLLLRSISSDRIHGEDGVVAALEGFFEKLEELNLDVTKAVADDLYALRDELLELPEDAKADRAIAERYSSALAKLDATLDAELGLRLAYIIQPKRFEISKLLDDPSALFAKHTPGQLSNQAKRDIVAGFQCIAFDQPTAAAFHLLRSTEEMIKQIYIKTVKQKRLKTPMWGPMVDALRKRKTNRPNDELLDHLDTIRKNYRNPTQHPEKFYDIDEAQDLVSTCISALNMIAAAIQKVPK